MLASTSASGANDVQLRGHGMGHGAGMSEEAQLAAALKASSQDACAMAGVRPASL